MVSEKALILVVEDEAIVAMNLQRMLKSLGYAVADVADSGEEAIKLAADLSPKLILMDIRLSGTVDGIEAAEEIRGRFDIPVVYLTAFADEATLQRAKLTGPFAYLLKPVEERAIHTAVEVALYKHEMEAKLKESEELYRVVVENLFDSISIRSKGRFIFVNKAFLDLHDLEGRSEAIGLEQDHFILPEDREHVTKKDLLENRGGPNVYEYRIGGTDEEVRTVQTANVTVTYQGLKSSLQVCRDVTELRRAVQDLLTPRQREILRLIAMGKRNNEIWETISVARATLGREIRKCKKQLRVDSRAQLGVEALKMNLL